MNNKKSLHRWSFFVFMLCGLMLTAGAAERRGTDFDHLRTGFPLTGAHANVECQTCHARGVFKGTPRECILCHNPTRGIASTTKPANHIPTTLPCEQCHTATATWAGARFSHTGVAPGSCATCHNGRMAAGKSANHPMTTQSCDVCHRTTAWLPASAFNHSGVTPGTCASCHNGSRATGKSARHIPTTAVCDQCHRTSSWVPTLGNTSVHTGVAPGNCSTCHNGSFNGAAGKSANHVATTAPCDSCHRTTAWIPATFSHANVAPGSCGTCHNGTNATGKGARHIPTSAACDQCHRIAPAPWTPTLGNTAVHTGIIPGQCGTCHNGSYAGAAGKSTNHVATTQSCDTCHRTTAWIPAGYDHSGTAPGGCLTCHADDKPTGHFVTARVCDVCHTIPTGTLPTGRWPVRYPSHLSAYFVAHSATVNNNCAGCHGTPSTETISTLVKYSPPPTCYGCHTHSNAFKSGPHKKTATPATNYTAIELHNCSGACHYYQTTVGGALKESRPGPRHTPTNGRGM